MYYNLTQHLFDLVETPQISTKTFKWPSNKKLDSQEDSGGSIGSQDETYMSKFTPNDNSKFLEFVLYDQSVTRTNKIFRGIFVYPLENVGSQELESSGQFYKFPNVDQDHTNSEIFEELKKRGKLKPTSIEAKFVKDIYIFMEEQRKAVF